MTHPLFPYDETRDDAAPELVERIQVTRWEKGRQVWHPRDFGPEEIQSTQDLFSLFGGGRYEIIARAPGDERLKKLPRRTYTLPGKSLPFVEEEQEEKPAAAAAPAPAPAQDSGGAIAAVFGSLMTALINNQGILAQGQQQMATLMLENVRADSRAQADALTKTAEMNMRMVTEFSGKVVELATRAPAQPEGGGGAGDALAQGLEIGLGLGQRVGGGEALPAAVSNFMTGLVQYSDNAAKVAQAKAEVAKAAANGAHTNGAGDAKAIAQETPAAS